MYRKNVKNDGDAVKIQYLANQGLIKTQISKELDMKYSRVFSLCKLYDIKIQTLTGIPENKDRIIELRDQGKSIKYISQFLGINYDNLCEYIVRKKINFEVDDRHRFTMDEQKIIKDLIESGYTLGQIASNMDCEYVYIWNFCKTRKIGFKYKYPRWNDDEIQHLKSCVNERVYNLDISKNLQNRTRSSVSQKTRNINLNAKGRFLSGEDSASASMTNEKADNFRRIWHTRMFFSMKEMAEANCVSYRTLKNILNYNTYIRHLKLDNENIDNLRKRSRLIRDSLFKKW